VGYVERTSEALVLTEIACAEQIVISAESASAKENIVERKTIVYETLVDPTVIRVAGEKTKNQLFTRFGFLKPKSEEVQFVSMDKYYEPYIVISGKYMIDYYRKCAYTIRVDEGVKEVVLLNNTFVPEQTSGSTTKAASIKLEGEERLVKETKAFLILNKHGQDAKMTSVPSAPSEKNPQEVIAKSGIREIAQNVDIDFARDRLVKRPNDINRIVNEAFEISERSVIYAPRFKLLYKNVKTGQQGILKFDGVTSQRIQQNESIIAQGAQIIESTLKQIVDLMRTRAV
jgi:hypothetical protein